jgi:hypothetical protein
MRVGLFVFSATSALGLLHGPGFTIKSLSAPSRLPARAASRVRMVNGVGDLFRGLMSGPSVVPGAIEDNAPSWEELKAQLHQASTEEERGFREVMCSPPPARLPLRTAPVCLSHAAACLWPRPQRQRTRDTATLRREERGRCSLHILPRHRGMVPILREGRQHHASPHTHTHMLTWPRRCRHHSRTATITMRARQPPPCHSECQQLSTHRPPLSPRTASVRSGSDRCCRVRRCGSASRKSAFRTVWRR